MRSVRSTLFAVACVAAGALVFASTGCADSPVSDGAPNTPGYVLGDPGPVTPGPHPAAAPAETCPDLTADAPECCALWCAGDDNAFKTLCGRTNQCLDYSCPTDDGARFEIGICEGPGDVPVSAGDHVEPADMDRAGGGAQ